MNKLVLMAFAFVFVGCHLTTPRGTAPSPLEDTPQDFSVMIRSQRGIDFSSAVGGFDFTQIDLCGLNGFSGQGAVTLSLENAPAGVSLSLPSNGKLDVFEICPTAPNVTSGGNVKLSVAENAKLGNAQPFFLVLKSQNITKRIAATFTIFTIPAQEKDFSVLMRSSTDFSSAVGGFDLAMMELCSGAAWEGEAQISLENAPVGVSLSSPSNGKLYIYGVCPAPTNQVKLNVAANAQLGNAQPFFLVIQYQNITKRIPVTFTIFTIPAK